MASGGQRAFQSKKARTLGNNGCKRPEEKLLATTTIIIIIIVIIIPTIMIAVKMVFMVITKTREVTQGDDADNQNMRITFASRCNSTNEQ